MIREWIEREADASAVQNLKDELNLSSELARVIVGRGAATLGSAKTYLEPELAHLSDPFLMADVDKACERLIHAIENKEPIGIFGDYDVDGVCSTAALWDFLERVGGQVSARIPNRLIDGYGLNVRLLEQLKAQGVKLVVTVDCGITNHDEIDKAFEMGMEVIVVDHHTVPVQLPKAFAVINPHRESCPMQATYLCAAGVVFYLCMALRKRLRERGHFGVSKEPVLKDLLDLIALATVADVMALKDANRVIVKHGLDVLARKKRAGLSALMNVAGLDSRKLTASSLGFQLGPRINAAGRLDDASVALRLLRMKDAPEALSLAQLLDQHNQDRREEEKRIVSEATAEVEASVEHQKAYVIVVSRETWHPGVVGIVASRLVERFGKPAIVIGADGKGSGRSIAAFHLHNALVSIASHMKGFGGHAHAIGLHIDPSNVQKFRDALNAYAKQVLNPEDFVQKMIHDGPCDIDRVSEEFISELQRAAPFGRSNPEPVFLLENVRLSQFKELRGGHVRGRVAKGKDLAFVAFGMQDRFPKTDVVADVLGTFEINEWNQNRTVQLRVRDIRVD